MKYNLLFVCAGLAATSLLTYADAQSNNAESAPTMASSQPTRAAPKPTRAGPQPTRAGGDPMLFDMPFKGQDLKEGEYIYRNKSIHTASTTHSQHWGYDLKAMRWDDANDRWTSVYGSADDYNDNPTNAKKVAYGKKVYAVSDGVITNCWRNAPENPRPKISGDSDTDKPWLSDEYKDGLMHNGGNFVQYKLSDGSSVRQSHFQPGSVPSDICPNNASLYTTASDSSQTDVVGGAIIKSGQYLGLLGNAGNSTEPHLHIHRSDSGTPKELRFRRGMAAPYTGDESDMDNWTRFAGKRIPPGPTLIWPPRTVGGEYTRFGLASSKMGRMFDHLLDSGFWPASIDGYSVGGKVYYNFVWTKAPGKWRGYFGQTQASFNDKLNQAKADGYQPVLIESYTHNGQVRYAAVYRKGISGTWRVKSNRTTAQYDAILDEAKADGLKPTTISVASIGGQRRYTVLFRSNSIGSWQVKSTTEESDYQQVFNANKAAGRYPIHLNAYKHQGTSYIAAIFASKPSGAYKARHKMSGSQLQNEFNSAMSSGMRTKVITSIDGAQTQHRYAAIWRK